MGLPYYKSDDQSFTLMQTAWASQINPLLGNPLLQGVLQKNITLKPGLNVINHKLGRAYQGYVIVDMHNFYSQIFSTTSTTPALTLNLNSSTNTSIDIYCF